jgi:putative endonuclease
MNKSNLGSFGEEFAVNYLKSKKYQILDRNFHSRFGEIDIIVRDNKDNIIFVEVKAYADKSLFAPQQAVIERKKKKLIKTAQYYCYKNKITDNSRFDVIAITLDSQNKPSLEHFEDAFRVN